MKKLIFLAIILLLPFCFQGQNYQSYNKAIKQSFYSKNLKDSVHIELIIPKNIKNNVNKYPVIYLLDKQLQTNYRYNLHTIDYLTTMQNMPESVIVGIDFSRKNRGSWTNPNKTKGKADDLILFITSELQKELKNKYPISNFKLLIGHSRTAIFSAYALSKRFDFFNGAISSSVANFDFGDEYQKQTFDTFTSSISSSSHNYFFYFSTGEKKYGDLHEASVDSLYEYLKNKALPVILDWQFYKHKTDHMTTPALTVARSLAEVFKRYGNKIQRCFDIVNNPIYANKVPWKEYEDVFASVSKDLGFAIKFRETFFNSIGSAYYNDYFNLFKENKLQFTLEILLKAIETYPNNYDYFSWVAEIYYDLKDFEKGNKYIDISLSLIKKNASLTHEEKKKLSKEVFLLKPK